MNIEQEPEAWIIVNRDTGYRTQVSDLTPFLYHREIFEVIPLYTAPPKREQEPEPLLAETKIEWYGKGFRQGVNEFAPPKPLTEDVIYALDKEGIVENMDDHQVRYVIRWIRRVEKAHGIGGGE